LRQQGQAFNQRFAVGKENSRLDQENANLRLRTASIFGYDPETGAPTLSAIKAAKQAAVNATKAKKIPSATAAKLKQMASQKASDAANGYWANPSQPDKPLSQATLDAALQKAGTLNPADVGYGFYHKTYQDTIGDLLAQGLPLAWAQQALNRYWKPGESKSWEKNGQGRPLVPYQVRQGKASAAAETAASQRGLAAANLVGEYLGTPYSWGGGGAGGPSYGTGRGASTKGFDCSALLQFAWAKQGVAIPRVTYDQWRTGTAVAKNALQPGDAVFFDLGARGPEHVGLYVGAGQFIEAPHTGASVRISNLAGRSDYVGARRYG
jgi:cell wall-associated NlpC family hydrolase